MAESHFGIKLRKRDYEARVVAWMDERKCGCPDCLPSPAQRGERW